VKCALDIFLVLFPIYSVIYFIFYIMHVSIITISFIAMFIFYIFSVSTKIHKICVSEMYKKCFVLFQKNKKKYT